VTADVYGGRVKFNGTIEGLGMGTGSAFALLPAQNATGNWIKVVQRVPVRIALDPEQVEEHPLRIGLSTRVEVDVRNSSGGQLATAPRVRPVLATSAYDVDQHGIDDRIAQIIAENGVTPGKAAAAKGAVAAKGAADNTVGSTAPANAAGGQSAPQRLARARWAKPPHR